MACAARSAPWLSGLNALLASRRKSWDASPSATAEKHYRVRPHDLLRKWHTKIEAWILLEAAISQPLTTDRLRAVDTGPETQSLSA
jgi:hypothetical protein